MKEKLLAALEAEAKKSTSSVFDIAVMDKDGISSVRPTPSNYANNYYSVAKAFTTAGVLLLIDQGKIDPDELIYPILREYFPKEHNEKWERVTVAHCIRHKMGIGEGFLDLDVEDQRTFGEEWLTYAFTKIDMPNEPGGYAVYSDGAFYILSRIVEQVSGTELSFFLEKNLTYPMEFRDHAWSKCPGNHAVGASGLYAAAEDGVKLGWLYVNGGRYKDKQIISEKTIELACARDFGLQQVDDRGIWWKGGMNGQMLIADRKRDLAISWHTFDRDGVNDRMIDIVLA